jgi:hypothetical protein
MEKHAIFHLKKAPALRERQKTGKTYPPSRLNKQHEKIRKSTHTPMDAF